MICCQDTPHQFPIDTFSRASPAQAIGREGIVQSSECPVSDPSLRSSEMSHLLAATPN